MIKVAGNFTRQIAISKSYFELIWVNETSTNNLDKCVTLGRTTLGFNLEASNRCIEKSRLFISIYVSKNTVFSINIDFLRSLFKWLVLMANITFTPRVRMTMLIDCKSTIITALDANKRRQSFSLVISLYQFRNPSGLFVTNAQLTVNIETPGVKLAIISQSSCMSVASSTADNLGFIDISFLVSVADSWEFHFSRSADLAVLSKTELTNSALTPSI